MRTYTIGDACQLQEEVFTQAKIEPILLTDQTRPSHVILSADAYQSLITRLTELEEIVLGKAAEASLSQSQWVGSESFTKALQELADGEA